MTYGLIFFSHQLGFAGKNIDYNQGATLLKTYIENSAWYSSYSLIMVSVYSITELEVSMTKSGMSSPITFIIGFNSNGVMNSYTVSYGIDTIIRIELISGGGLISGYYTMYILGILIFGIIGLILFRYKRYSFTK